MDDEFNDMVERVARAMAGVVFDSQSAATAKGSQDEFIEDNWERYEGEARAALA
jgi:hypothetical protein